MPPEILDFVKTTVPPAMTGLIGWLGGRARNKAQLETIQQVNKTSEFDRINRLVDELQQENKESRDEIRSLRAEIRTMRSEQATEQERYKAQIRHLEAQVSQLQAQLSDLTPELAAKDRRITALLAEIDELKQQLSATRA